MPASAIGGSGALNVHKLWLQSQASPDMPFISLMSHILYLHLRSFLAASVTQIWQHLEACWEILGERFKAKEAQDWSIIL